MAKFYKWRRWAIGFLVIALAFIALIWALTSLVINFAPASRRTPQEFVKIAAAVPGGLERVSLTSSDGVKVAAWYLPPRNAPVGESWGVVLSHGGGDDKATYIQLAERLRDHGYHVVLPDLRGSGESDPSPHGTTLGVSEGRDVAAAAAFLADGKHVQHIAAGGVSMGGVATVMGAAAEPRIGPLIIESSSYRSQRVFDYMLAQFNLPDGSLRSNFSSILNAVGVWRMGGEWADVREGTLPTWRLAPKIAPHPVLFVYGDRDPLVHKEDIEQFRKRFAGPTQVLVAKNTGHGVYGPHTEAYSKAVMEFLDIWRNGARMPVAARSSAEQPLPGV